MYQSISVVPIPPGISWAFAHLLIPAVEHLKLYYCPRGRAFVYSRDDPEPFDDLVVLASLVAENANIARIEDLAPRDDSFELAWLTNKDYRS